MIHLDRLDQWGSPMMAQAAPVQQAPPIQTPAPAPATPANTATPFNLPKWMAISLGGAMIGVGLYSTLTEVEVPPMMAPPGFESTPSFTISKTGIDKAAGVGSVLGGAYILMESLGLKF